MRIVSQERYQREEGRAETNGWVSLVYVCSVCLFDQSVTHVAIYAFCFIMLSLTLELEVIL